MSLIDPFDPVLHTGVINKLPIESTLFRSFFTPKMPSEKDIFELDVVNHGIAMLPTVKAHSAGTMRQGSSTETVYIKAPRFRPKRGFAKPDVFKRAAGVTRYDALGDPVQRALLEDMSLHRKELDYALEVMCAQAVVTGKLQLYDVIDGKSVPTYTVDFKRPAKHNVILSGNALWSNENSDLEGQIESYDTMIQEEVNVGSSDLYLGSTAWKYFRKHKDVKDTIEKNSGIDAGSLAMRVGRKFKGTWNGLNVWVVSGTYVDVDGAIKNFIEPDHALLVASGVENWIEFGMPMDIECPHPVEVFAKVFTQDDPSGIFSLAESRPLPWTRQPGFVVSIKVA